MTKKDYEKIQDIFYKEFRSLHILDRKAKDANKKHELFVRKEDIKGVMYDLMQVFREGNPKFDWWKFHEGCGLDYDGHFQHRQQQYAQD